MKIHLRKRKVGNKKAKNPNYSLYLDIYYSKGLRKREFLGIYLDPKDDNTNRKEKLGLAENIKGKRIIELTNDEYGITSKERKKQDFIQYFHLQIQKRKGNTKITWETTYTHLTSYAGNHLPFSNINKQWVEGFVNHIKSKVSSNSSFMYYSKLKCVINESIKDGILTFNPCSQISSIKQTKISKEYLTVDEILRIANTPFKYDVIKRAFLFSCFTGLRYSDIMSLRWNQIKEFTNEGNDKSYYIELVQSKTQNAVTIPLSKSALNLLGTPSNIDQLVFQIVMTHRNIQRILKLLLVVSKINKKITFHSARHTYAIMLLSNGANLMVVKELLGHSNLRSTQVYAKVIDSSKQIAVAQLPQIEI